VQIDPLDNVAVALDDIAAGSRVLIQGTTLEALDRVPFAHKMAIQAIAPGEPILKYGVPIAFATASIKPGGWVHEHNAQAYFAARRKVEP
jgi:altronate hydrolase